ncbi:MAG: hypothetical protein R2762_26360 [Bryobacteraceae bacterium]
MAVDGFRFLDAASRKVMRAWQGRESDPSASPIPWARIEPGKTLRDLRVALISSAGIALAADTPFDQEGERQDPWWGDPTHRVLPREAKTADCRIYHMHVDPRPATRDLDCMMPLRRLDELVVAGVVGSSAPDHYSIMGYILEPTVLIRQTAPRIADALVRDQVDLALLVPV